MNQGSATMTTLDPSSQEVTSGVVLSLLLSKLVYETNVCHYGPYRFLLIAIFYVLCEL